MRKRKYRYFMADFETTVYKGQVNTEVWAGAIVELFTEDVTITHSIEELFDYLIKVDEHIICYFHNLKFDGSFWLYYLMVDLGLKQAYEQIGEEPNQVAWLKEKDMPYNSFKYSISDKGMWYTIIMNIGGKIIELRDSYKLLPFSVKRIGESFGTKHKKLDMEYKGYRYAGCSISEDEEKYIKNDVLVVKEALEIMFNQGHTDLTIGSCCLKEFKRIIGKEDYNMYFPDVYEILIDEEKYGYDTVGKYIWKSYKGGWCYLVKGKERKIYHDGVTADVNSLYSSVMSSESGNRYPVGIPCFWKGNIIPDKALLPNRYYFVRIKTRFYLKEGMLPFIQIKGSFLYKGTEALESSDVYDAMTDTYHEYIVDKDGNLKDTRVELTLTMTDFELIKEHYELVDFEILDGCWFYSEIGIFDNYIEKFKKIKMESEGAIRESAKLFLNNLYGKMASSTDSSFKLAYIKEDKSIGFLPVKENNKKGGYIPVGSAITSYARDFTIRAAQKNYYGKDKKGFIYADTDSIHCDIPYTELKGITVDNNNFCCWKLESFWDIALFTRQKTYIEHVTHQNMRELEKPFYDIKCAGMPQKCKQLFMDSMNGECSKEDYTDEEKEFISKKRELCDFDIGLKIPGKLMPRNIRGGVLLVDTTYEMR